MDPDKAATPVDVTLKRAPLFIVFKRFVIRVRENDRLVLPEILVSEYGGLITHINAETVFAAKLFDSLDRAGYVVVNIALSLRYVVAGVNEEFRVACGKSRQAPAFEETNRQNTHQNGREEKKDPIPFHGFY
jgi:hypothetical protein